jgi:hypothetical protein
MPRTQLLTPCIFDMSMAALRRLCYGARVPQARFGRLEKVGLLLQQFAEPVLGHTICLDSSEKHCPAGAQGSEGVVPAARGGVHESRGESQRVHGGGDGIQREVETVR